MDIKIIKSFPLGIKEQLIRQLITMIETQFYNEGDMLLSAKDLATYLSINRNTVASVYKELEQSGYLKIIKGSGTYVRQTTPLKNANALEQIFDNAYIEALDSGHTPEQIDNFFISGLLQKTISSKKAGKVILIDCNYEVLDTLDKQIKRECDIESHFMLIQDIEKFPDKFIKRIKGYDLILCGMNHMEELKTAIPHLSVETIGFMIKTNFTIMNHLTQIPRGTSVGFCCISQKSSEAFFKTTLISTGLSLKRVHAGISDILRIEHILKECDLIFATNYVYNKFIETYPTLKTVHRVDLEIDQANLDFILSRLTRPKRNQSK